MNTEVNGDQLRALALDLCDAIIQGGIAELMGDSPVDDRFRIFADVCSHSQRAVALHALAVGKDRALAAFHESAAGRELMRFILHAMSRVLLGMDEKDSDQAFRNGTKPEHIKGNATFTTEEKARILADGFRVIGKQGRTGRTLNNRLDIELAFDLQFGIELARLGGVDNATARQRTSAKAAAMRRVFNLAHGHEHDATNDADQSKLKQLRKIVQEIQDHRVGSAGRSAGTDHP